MKDVEKAWLDDEVFINVELIEEESDQQVKNSFDEQEKEEEVLEKRKRNTPLSFTTYTLTNKRIIIQSGFFKRKEEEILLYRIKDIVLIKHFIKNKLQKTASIEIEAKGGGRIKTTLKNIKDYRQFKKLLSAETEKEKTRFHIQRLEMKQQSVNKTTSYNINYNDNY